MRHKRPLLRLAGGLTALLLVAAACGDSDDVATDGDGDGDGGNGELAVTAGFDGTTIKLGMLSPQSDAVAVIGRPLTNGHLVYYDYVNTELGGIAGKYQIEVDVGDITYADTSTTLREYNRIKGDVVMFSQILGTPHITAVLEQLGEDGLVAAPATLDSAWVTEPNLLPIGAPYQIQSINGLDYYVNEEGSAEDVICAAIMDNEYGAAGLAGLEFAAGELGVELAATARHKQGDTNMSTTISALSDAGCEMVWLTSLPTEAGTIMGTAAAGGYAPKWYLQSPSYIGLFVNNEGLLPYLEANVRVVAEGTSWDDDTVPAQVDLVSRAATYLPDQGPDYYFGFGYNQAVATVALLEKAVELGDLSHDGILAALGELGTVDFGGTSGTYVYGETREPPRANTIFGIAGDRPFGLTVLERDYQSELAEDFAL